MDRYMSVSCIVSVFNGETSIEKCINSVLVQSYPFDKLIVYNDASTDGTVACIKKLMKNEMATPIILIDSDVNRGPGGGKDYAVQYADTDYFMFLDADDYLENTFLKTLVEEIHYRQDALPDIVFANFTSVDINGQIRYWRKFKDEQEALYGHISNWGKLFKKTFWTEHHLKIPEGKVLEDVLLRAYIVGCNPTVCYAEKTYGYYYVSNPKSVSHTYMNSFIKGVGEKEFSYLHLHYYDIARERKEEYVYWVYKIYCWHMLKSGSSVGMHAMREEYHDMKYMLKQFFPEYIKNPYLYGRNSLKPERRIVRIAVRGMYWLDVLHLQSLFLYIYGLIDLKRWWPDL